MADESPLSQADVLASLDAFVKTGGLAKAEKVAAKEPDVQDVPGGEDEPEAGEAEVTTQAEAASESDDKQDDAEEIEQEETPQRVRVKVDGQDVEVTLDELKDGYSREADYRRKTQAHADGVRQWEAQKEQTLKAERDKLSVEREQYKSVLGIWETQINSALGQNTDWDTLRRDNPGEWSAKMTERHDWMNKLNGIKAETERMAAEDRTKRESELRAKLSAEAQKLVEAIPEWKDQKAYLADSQSIFDYTNGRGFRAEEVSPLVAQDHRWALVLKDAAAYRALTAKKPETQKKIETAKPMPAGASQTQNSKASNLGRLRETQAKRGDQKSTVALLEALYT